MQQAYNRGERIRLTGYDYCAHATRPDTLGELRVLNNNSTHYLVVNVHPSDTTTGTFLQSFKYEESEDSVYLAYVQALTIMAVETYNICQNSKHIDPGPRMYGGDPACPTR